MTASLNTAIILGNVGREPEIRTTTNGSKVANLTVATSRKWKDKATGEQKKLTQWHRVTVWGSSVDFIEGYVKKGSLVLVQGELQTREYEKDGKKQYSTEIVVQGPGSDLKLIDSKSGDSAPAATPARSNQEMDQPHRGHDDMDDEIPF